MVPAQGTSRPHISCRAPGFASDIERCPTRCVLAVNCHARRPGPYPARRRGSYPARRLGPYPARRLVVPAGALCYANCIFFRLDWSMPNARLYNEAFTGHARTIPRCSFCLQEDHLAQACPRNPNRPWFGWYNNPSAVPSQQAGQAQELCRRFNNEKCKQPAFNCRYAHRCAECGGPHSRLSCSRGGQRGRARPRSPIQSHCQQQTRFPGASATGPATGPQDPTSGSRF